jgi:hypothetical protein
MDTRATGRISTLKLPGRDVVHGWDKSRIKKTGRSGGERKFPEK